MITIAVLVILAILIIANIGLAFANYISPPCAEIDYFSGVEKIKNISDLNKVIKVKTELVKPRNFPDLSAPEPIQELHTNTNAYATFDEEMPENVIRTARREPIRPPGAFMNAFERQDSYSNFTYDNKL